MRMAPDKYIDKMISSYEQLFGSKPCARVSSTLEKGDHPEIDTSELLDEKGIHQYQLLIGALQWAPVSIGRIDITTAAMALSCSQCAPCQGHLDPGKRVYGYLAKMKHASTIRVRTEDPDYSGLPEQNFDWAYSVYGNIQEATLDDRCPRGTRKIRDNYVLCQRESIPRCYYTYRWSFPLERMGSDNKHRRMDHECLLVTVILVFSLEVTGHR
jgi:hypothetical protein